MNRHKNRHFALAKRWLTTTAAVLAMAPAAMAQCPTNQCTITYSGLQYPYGIVQSNTGSLLVAEGGTPVPNTGRISIVDLAGNRRTLLNGLPSGLNDVGSPSGPSGLFMRGQTLYVAIGVGDAALAGQVPGSILANPNPSSPLFSSVLALDFSSNTENGTAGFALTLADQRMLAAGGKVTLSNRAGGDLLFIQLVANFPDYTPKPFPTAPANVAQSNPFALVGVADRLYVTDGGQNKIWWVDLPTGSAGTLTEFRNIPNPLFPNLGGPFEEAVPTGIAYSGGRLLVTLFRGFPFAQDMSVVEQVDPVTGTHSPFITGLNSAVGVLPLRDQANSDYLVLVHASFGPFFEGPGLVQRFATPNSPGAIATNCLMFPTSMVLDAKTGTLFVAEQGGRVIAIRIAP